MVPTHTENFSTLAELEVHIIFFLFWSIPCLVHGKSNWNEPEKRLISIFSGYPCTNASKNYVFYFKFTRSFCEKTKYLPKFTVVSQIYRKLTVINKSQENSFFTLIFNSVVFKSFISLSFFYKRCYYFLNC